VVEVVVGRGAWVGRGEGVGRGWRGRVRRGCSGSAAAHAIDDRAGVTQKTPPPRPARPYCTSRTVAVHSELGTAHLALSETHEKLRPKPPRSATAVRKSIV